MLVSFSLCAVQSVLVVAAVGSGFAVFVVHIMHLVPQRKQLDAACCVFLSFICGRQNSHLHCWEL